MYVNQGDITVLRVGEKGEDAERNDTEHVKGMLRGQLKTSRHPGEYVESH